MSLCQWENCKIRSFINLRGERGAWGHGSFTKVLATEVWGPGFRSPAQKNLIVVVYIGNPGTVKEIPQAHCPAKLSESVSSSFWERPCLKDKVESKRGSQPTFTSGLHMAHSSVHASCINTYAPHPDTHTHNQWKTARVSYLWYLLNTWIIRHTF